MSLSVTKLQDLLSTRGYITKNFFANEGMCFYVEVFCVRTADVFLLYIPSKYEIPIEKGKNVFALEELDLEDTSQIEKYTGKIDEDTVGGIYGDLSIDLSPTNHAEENLEGKYKHDINIKTISKSNEDELKGIYRQVKRLSFSVQKIDYKLGILFRNFLCVIRRDNSIDFFVIKGYKGRPCKTLYVCTDLEVLYSKEERMIDDIVTVKNSIYKLLERNQVNNGRLIDKITQSKGDIVNIPLYIDAKRVRYEGMIFELEKLLEYLQEKERELFDELDELSHIDELRLSDGRGTLENDIEKAHRKDKIDKKLDQINLWRTQIARNMLIIREKMENTILSMDKLLFDNTVMFDTIVKNFTTLRNFC